MNPRIVTLSLLFAAACSDEDRRPQVRTTEPQRPRREIDPPAGTTVRSLPPHAIRADGVGPYRLGEKVSAVMAQLRSGPRIARFEIPGVVSTSVIRAEEEDAVLIGGETTSTTTFVAVVGAEVARTDSNVHVGSTVDELVRGIGPLFEDPEHARDPRLVVPTALRNARVVLARDRIAAFVIAIAPERAPIKVGPQPEAACKRPEPSSKKQLGACLSGVGEIVEVGGDEIVVHPPDSERVLYTLRAPGLVFAAPLRNPSDGRDELVVVTRSDESHRRTWTLVAYRLEGPRIQRVIDQELYTLTAMQSRWIGAELGDVDLYLELASEPEAIEVGGLLTTRAGQHVRDVALLSPKVVTRRHHKPGPGEPADAKAPAGGSAAAAAPRSD
ncbi:MAG TPA: hypothetical protein VNO30_19055 [Kofleriaceae bacterium]|nr:hypothetical protein [Kofleriaceae bacterium]